MQSAEQIQKEYERRDRDATYWLVVELRDHGASYSRELRDRLHGYGVDLTVGRVWMMLTQLEKEKHFESELRYPPFADTPSGGIIRRYFWLKDER